jgi:class 3 adenylate cyclase
VSAALAMALAPRNSAAGSEKRFASAPAPFAIGVGLHAGRSHHLPPGHGAEQGNHAIGDTVNTAARLEAPSKELGWTVVAERAVLRQAGEGVQTRA